MAEGATTRKQCQLQSRTNPARSSKVSAIGREPSGDLAERREPSGDLAERREPSGSQSLNPSATHWTARAVPITEQAQSTCHDA